MHQEEGTPGRFNPPPFPGWRPTSDPVLAARPLCRRSAGPRAPLEQVGAL